MVLGLVQVGFGLTGAAEKEYECGGNSRNGQGKIGSCDILQHGRAIRTVDSRVKRHRCSEDVTATFEYGVMTIRTLFGLLVVVAPLHMGEQLLTGLDELYRLKAVLAVYLSWFDDPDYGIVVLVTIAGTLFLLLAYGLLLGGRARQLAIGLLGVLAVTESHHLFTAVARGGYSPGVITAIPFVVIGVLMLREIKRGARTNVA